MDFEGHQPRDCAEHRTLGSHRAWCFACSEYCYPRIEAACRGCQFPFIMKMLDDMADVLARMGRQGEGAQNDQLDRDYEAVIERYRTFKGET